LVVLLALLAGCSKDAEKSAAPKVEEKTAALNATPQINNFAVLATNSVRLQASTIVNGGDVGAKGTGSGTFLTSGVVLDVGASARVETTRNLIAQSIRLGAGAIVGDVQTTTLTGTGTRGTLSALVALPTPPAAVAVTVGTATLNAAAGATVAGSPGRFASMNVGASGKLRLAAGVYEVGDVTLATSARIEALGAIELRIANRLSLATSAFIGPATGVTLTANQIRVEVSGINGTTGTLTATPVSAAIGASAQINGLFLVPNGTVSLATSVIATGAIVARDVDFATGARITFQSGFTNSVVAPSIQTQPVAQTVVVGSTATFSAVVTGSNLTYQWQKNGANIAGATATSYTTPALAKSDSGATYRLTAQNSAGSVQSNSVAVTVVDCLVGSYTPQPTTCGVGRCAAAGERRCVNNQIVDTCVAGAPTSELCNGLDDDCNGTVDGLAPRCTGSNLERCTSGAWVPQACNDNNACNGSEQCSAGACVAGTAPVVDDGNPCTADSCAAASGVQHTPISAGTSCGSFSACDGAGSCQQLPAPSIQTQPTAQTVVVGSSATFSAVVTGTGLSLQWQRDGVAIPGATSASYTTPALAKSDSGASYRLLAQNPAGQVLSNSVTVTVVDCLVATYVPQPTSCGVGRCAATGQRRCVSNQIQDTCTPGTPTAELCNGLDDDCNGAVDGLAARCAGTGIVERCSSGSWVPQACSDNDACNGAEQCASGACVAGTPPAVDDANPCTADSCVPASGAQHTPIAAGTSCGAFDACDNAGHCNPLPAPTFQTQPTSQTVLVGSAATFSAVVSGSAVTLQWQKNGAPIPGATASSYSTAALAKSDTGTTFQLIAQNPAGQVASNSVTVSVVDCLVTSYQPQPTSCGTGRCAAAGQRVCVNGEIQDTCQVGSGTAETCNGVDDDCDGSVDGLAPRCTGGNAERCIAGNWLPEACSDNNVCNGVEQCALGACAAGTPASLDDGNLCTSDSCSAANGVQHTPVPAGAACAAASACDGSGNCVALQPPQIVAQPSDQTGVAGGEVTFSVGATGTNLSFQWLRAGEVISGATSASYTRPNLQLSDDNVRYSVRVQNAAASVTSSDAILHISNVARAASIQIVGENPRSLEADYVVLTGTALDGSRPASSVEVRSDQFGALSFGAVVDENGTFSAEIPLALGSNVLTARVVGASSSAEAALTVYAGTSNLPRISITSPASGASTQQTTINVSGIVRSSLPPGQIRLLLGNQVTFPTGPEGAKQYNFVFEGVALTPGANTLTVRAETVYGNVTVQTVVTRNDGSASTSTQVGPTISVQATGSEVFVPGPSVPVAGVVTAKRCVSQVTVNGSAARLTGVGASVSFEASLAFAAGVDSLPIVVQARDCDNGVSSVSYTARRDLTPPVLSVANLQLAPAPNEATNTPYPVRGTVTELNLAGLSANQQSIGVLPTGSGSYDFGFDLALVRGVAQSVVLEAWDVAGNRSSVTFNLTLNASLDIAVVSPADGASFLAQDSSGTFDVVARVAGIGPSDRVVAKLDDAAEVQLPLSGDVARGTLTAGSGDHTLSLTAQSAQGQTLASRTLRFKVAARSAVVLALGETDPVNASAAVEGNAPIFVRLSKAIEDPLKLILDVRETVHAMSYKAGQNAGVLPEVARVDREREVVTGRLSVLPGNDSARFEPSREFAYGARVEVQVRYDGDAIGKFDFQIRPLPTLATGSVFAASGEPIAGAQVELVELGRSTVSDSGGSYNFGFGEPAARDLPAGVYTLRVNGKGSATGFGDSVRRVSLEQGRYNSFGMTRLPNQSVLVPARLVEGGQSAVLFDNGKLSLDLTQASIRMRDGAVSGAVHIEPYLFEDLTFTSVRYARPAWLYAAAPTGVAVNGNLGVTLSLPTIDSSYAYLDQTPSRMLLVGRDAKSLDIVTVGVGVIDKAARKLRSEGQTHFQSLDAIGYAPIGTTLQPVLERYGRGEIGLEEMNREIGKVVP
jgi:hypothetical protein